MGQGAYWRWVVIRSGAIIIDDVVIKGGVLIRGIFFGQDDNYGWGAY